VKITKGSNLLTVHLVHLREVMLAIGGIRRRCCMTQTKTSDEGGAHSFLTHHSSTGCERKWVYDVDVPMMLITVWYRTKGVGRLCEHILGAGGL
jgi:hypothetical protein